MAWHGTHWCITISSSSGRTRQLRLTRLAGRLLCVLALVAVAGTVTVGATYVRMAKEAGKAKRYAEEVRRLREDNEKIVSLARELDAIREREVRLREMLGLSLPSAAPSSLATNRFAGGPDSLVAEAASGHGIPDLWPVNGYISRSFSLDGDPKHEGVDIAGTTGAPVHAAGSGTVTYAGVDSTFGNLVRIDHGNGYTTLYGHNSKLAVKSGQKVARGQVVAYLGNTGRSSAPHLHFEVRREGKPVDPMSLSRSADRGDLRSR